MTWTVSSLGAHVLSARAIDEFAQETWSPAVAVTITATAAPPVITVEALRADGTVAWTHDVPALSGHATSYLPDFGGGLVVFNEQSIARLDPLTGASQTLFEATSYGSQQEGLGLWT